MPLSPGAIDDGWSMSPRTTRTGLLFESAKVTIWAVSSFSVASTPAVSSFAGVPPRMILTGCHWVSGNETICTLGGFFSTTCLVLATTCLPVATVTRCLDLTAAFAAYPHGCVSSNARIAQGITPTRKPFRIDPPTDAADSPTV